jgi:DNA replication protein DnaC
MLNEPTTEKLKALGLETMAAAWLEQQQRPDIAALSFDERFGLLVDAEYTVRENKRMNRRLREAKLRLGQACVEDIDFPPRRELDRAIIRQLMNGRWVDDHLNVLVTGSTGTGKTYVACALAQLACRKGHRALYRRASRLFQELTMARADGSWVRTLAKLARVEVLVIDDFALGPLREQDRQDLLEVLEDRHGLHSTIMASQLPVKQWHDYLGEPTVADAILDRLINSAHRVALKGPSRRKPDPSVQEKDA